MSSVLMNQNPNSYFMIIIQEKGHVSRLTIVFSFNTFLKTICLRKLSHKEKSINEELLYINLKKHYFNVGNCSPLINPKKGRFLNSDYIL